MIYLVAVQEYKTSRGDHYTVGAVVECDEDRARYLNADAPGYFEQFDNSVAAHKRANKILGVETKALDTPPENKAIQEPSVRKKRGRKPKAEA